MKNQFFFGLTFAAVLACSPSASAQIPTTITLAPTFQQTSTTGMVGFTTNQTARLSVLNLNSGVVTVASLTPPAPNCTVELKFVDAQNNTLKQATVTNLTPGTATSLDMQRTEVTSQSTPRAEIRGVVIVNPATTPAATPAPAYCAVKVTLQIFDATSGSTVALTSDTSTVGSLFIPTLGQITR